MPCDALIMACTVLYTASRSYTVHDCHFENDKLRVNLRRCSAQEAPAPVSVT